MSNVEAKKIAIRYANKLKAEKYPFSAMYLFGSCAKGTSHRWSDIDIAIVSDEMSKNWRAGRMKLWKLTRDVDVRIEPHGFSPESFCEDWMPMVHEIKTTGIRIR
jgi:predicted nucleotidyltransferase